MSYQCRWNREIPDDPKDEHYDKPNHTVVLVCAVQTSAPALINQHRQRCHESIPRTTGDSLEINICLTSDARLRDERKNTAECHRTARTIKHQCWITTYATFTWAVFTWLNLYVNISSLHCNCIPLFTCKCKQKTMSIKSQFRSGKDSSTLAGESWHICCTFHGLGEH